jgi:hypothetical protein
MKYLLVFVLLVAAFGIAFPPLRHTHALPLAGAIEAGLCLAFAAYLIDPTDFLAYSAEMRKNATAWFKRGEP